MASFNKVILLGNLTRDPEIRTTNNGTQVCRLGVAMSRVTRGSNGENREEVVFVDVDAYGKQAEVIGQHFTKGRPIFIEGRLRLDQWESNTGEKRNKLYIILENFQFIGSAKFDEASASDVNFSNSMSTGNKNEKIAISTTSPLNSDAIDEDVPF